MPKDTSLIDEVLAHVDIVDVIANYVPLKRSGANFAGCCPFHHEKTPSFIVSPQKQIFKCFGCGQGGNIFTFIQEIEKIDFRDAVKFLAEREHIDISRYETTTAYQQHNKDEKEKLKRMHKLAQDFFVENLKKSPKAMSYLKEKRKLTDEIISAFGVGYAPDKSYELLQYLRSQGFTDADLLQGSLAKQSANSPETYAFFRHRIMFPIYDLMKNIVGFTARVLNPEESPKYLNSSEHKAFNKSKVLYGLSHAKDYITTFQKLIVVEGQMDVIGLTRLGFPIGVATSGTVLTDEHIKTIKRYTENLYFLFDNDKAGQQATFRALKLCYRQNLFPKLITLPSSVKDVDDVANLKEGKQLFGQYLEKSEDGFLAMFSRLRDASDMNSPVDKQKLINAMFELILSVENLAIQEHYKLLLAEKLSFAPEIITLQLEKYKMGEGRLFLRQQERQAIQEGAKTSYQLSREALFVSLFYKDFLSSLFAFPELTTFATQIAVALPDSLLAKTFAGDLTDPETSDLNEQQLRREKELGEL
ncbi:MAG: DNA primase [Candidatus Peribacteria bacterium]|jgi:DNA primase|nr:DNA primase [Candidatus Peribacteria bacterium]